MVPFPSSEFLSFVWSFRSISARPDRCILVDKARNKFVKCNLTIEFISFYSFRAHFQNILHAPAVLILALPNFSRRFHALAPIRAPAHGLCDLGVTTYSYMFTHLHKQIYERTPKSCECLYNIYIYFFCNSNWSTHKPNHASVCGSKIIGDGKNIVYMNITKIVFQVFIFIFYILKSIKRFSSWLVYCMSYSQRSSKQI